MLSDMQYCEKCRVYVSGKKRVCPLCQSELTGVLRPEEEIFPELPKTKYTGHFLVRLISFIAIAAAVAVVSLDLMLPGTVRWSLFAAAGIACAWVCIMVGIARRHNIMKKITFELLIVTLLAMVWDHFTGQNGWSVDYVLPCCCGAAVIATYVLSKIFKLQARDALFHIVLNGIYGIIPLFFLFTNRLHVVYPSIICAALSILALTAILLFDGRRIKEELTRRLHV